MNFNTSIYPNAVNGLTEKFNISAQAVRGCLNFYIIEEDC
jgi:hypothetical protein